MSNSLMRGIPRDKIRPWDGCLISIGVELGQVGCTSGAFVIGRRSAVLRVIPWAAEALCLRGRAAAAREPSTEVCALADRRDLRRSRGDRLTGRPPAARRSVGPVVAGQTDLAGPSPLARRSPGTPA